MELEVDVMKEEKPDLGQVVLVGFVVLIFWLLWGQAYQEAKQAAAPQVQEQYYVVVPY